MVELQPDNILRGRYRIIRPLAPPSGFGRTYLAEDSDRPGDPICVVKQLRSDSTNPTFLENARRLFQAEAETLQKLGIHDRIPQLLAFFTEEQEFFLVQDYIQGHSLNQELHAGYQWTEIQVQQLLRDVLEILHFIHQQNVIHRDIKPGNIMRRYKDHRMVLVDFGAVKQILPQPINVPTHLTIPIGTPGYMPPEQWSGTPCPSSDLYALGVIAIQALTGLAPHELPKDSRTGELVWQDRVEVHPALVHVLTKMVRYHFRDRYTSARSVLLALEAIADQPLPSPLGWLQRLTPTTPTTKPVPSSLPQVFPLDNTALKDGPLAWTSPPPAAQRTTASEKGSPAGPPLAPGHSSKGSPPPGIEDPSTRGERTLATPLSLDPTPALAADMPLAQEIDLSPGKLSPNPPITTQQPWVVRAGIAVALVGTIAGWLQIQRQEYNASRQAVAQITDLQSQGQYDGCIQSAREFTSRDRELQEQVQLLEGQCLLDQARSLAEQSRFRDAIAIASEISPVMQQHQVAQDWTETWAEQILAIAQDKYRQGQFDQAIAIAADIPEGSPVGRSAKQAIAQWSQEEGANTTRLETARQALELRRWQSALDTVASMQILGKPVEANTPYWTTHIKPIVDQANQGLEQQRQQAIQQQQSQQRSSSASSGSTSTRSAPSRSSSSAPARSSSTRSSTGTAAPSRQTSQPASGFGPAEQR